jgi:hypothetical protein
LLLVEKRLLVAARLSEHARVDRDFGDRVLHRLFELMWFLLSRKVQLLPLAPQRQEVAAEHLRAFVKAVHELILVVLEVFVHHVLVTEVTNGIR